MRNIVDRYLNIFRKERQVRRRRICVLSALALVIILGVFWQLRLTGITTGGEGISMSEEGAATEGSDLNDTDGEDMDSEGADADSSGLEEAGTGEEASEDENGDTDASDDEEGDTEEDINPEDEGSSGEEGDEKSEDGGLSDGEENADEENGTGEGTALTDGSLSDSEAVANEENSGDTVDAAAYVDEDLETSSDWEATFPELTGVWADDLVAVARSQVGYTEKEITLISIEEIVVSEEVTETEESEEDGESTETGEAVESEETTEDEENTENTEAVETGENTETGEAEVTGQTTQTVQTIVVEENKYGYTRYGAWYGDEYGDWNTVFALFCLHYAAVPEESLPRSADINTWIAELNGAGLYKEADDYTPSAGDMVFLDSDADGQADSVGIISGVTEEALTVVEGDSNDAVEEKSYSSADSSILAYGVMPEQEQAATEGSTYESLLAQMEELAILLQETSEQDDELSDEDIQKIQEIYASLMEILGEAAQALTERTLTEEEYEALCVTAEKLGLVIDEIEMSYTAATVGASNAIEALPEECISYNFYEVTDTDYETPVSVTNAMYYRLKIDIVGYTTDENGDTVVLLYANTTYIYDLVLPDGITINIDGDLTAGSSGEVVGSWEIVDNTLSITTNSAFNGYSEFRGYIKVMVLNTNAEEETSATIKKEDGVYDTEEQAIDWTITLTIPSHRSGETCNTYYVADLSDYSGYIVWDELIKSGNTFDVTLYSAEYEAEVELKSIDDVEDGDTVAYYADDTRLYLVNKCECDSGTCQNYEDDSCGNLLEGYDGWCTCWNSAYNVTVVINYSESVSDETLKSAVETGEYPVTNIGYLYVNDVRTGRDSANAEIPVLIGKTMDNSGMSSANDYSVDFTITVNESGADFSARSYLEVVDTLSNLIYTSGSMEIYKQGETSELLTEGVDYTLEVGEPDESSLKQTLKIIIYNPDTSTFIINYSACLWSYTSSSVPFENNVTFDGITVSTYDEFEFEFTAKKYMITVYKVDMYDNDLLLDGATFGLYRENGTLIKEDTTVDGQITFETDLSGGVIIESNTFYYIQEIMPPTGYIQDDTKYWVYYAADSDYEETVVLPDGIDSWDDVIVDLIGYTSDEAVIELTVVNEVGAALPETGGSGILLYMLTGLMLMGVSAYLLRKKSSAA